jgi:hypothetical protein
MLALLRDAKPQETESKEDEKGFQDKVHFRVRNVMKPKDPMDPDDVDAQHEAHAGEHTSKKCRRRRSLAPQYKSYQKSDRSRDYCDLTGPAGDRNQREREDQLHLRVIGLMKSSDDQQCSGKRTDEEHGRDKPLTPRRNASPGCLNHEHVASRPCGFAGYLDPTVYRRSFFQCVAQFWQTPPDH